MAERTAKLTEMGDPPAGLNSRIKSEEKEARLAAGKIPSQTCEKGARNSMKRQGPPKNRR